jgi:histidine phosphotransfer protein HptB
MPDISSDKSVFSRLEELEKETDFEFVVELIDLYLNETPKQINAIISAYDAKELHALTIAAHTLKGSSLNLGAKEFGALCLKFEELGRSGKPIPEGVGIKSVENEFQHVKEMLMAFKQSRQSS